MLQAITDSVTERMEMQSATIYLLEGETLYLGATSPALPPQFPEEFRRAPLADHPHIREAIATGLPVFLPDSATASLTPAERAVSEAHGLRSIRSLPLLVGVKVVGYAHRGLCR
jgi:GAF domain-containing protein